MAPHERRAGRTLRHEVRPDPAGHVEHRASHADHLGERSVSPADGPETPSRGGRTARGGKALSKHVGPHDGGLPDHRLRLAVPVRERRRCPARSREERRACRAHHGGSVSGDSVHGVVFPAPALHGGPSPSAHGERVPLSGRAERLVHSQHRARTRGVSSSSPPISPKSESSRRSFRGIAAGRKSW